MLTIGSRVEILKGVNTGQQVENVGVLVRTKDGKLRGYVFASVKEVTPYVPIRVTVGQPLVAEVSA